MSDIRCRTARGVRTIRAVVAGTAMLLASACGGTKVPLPVLPAEVIGDTAGLVTHGEYIVRTVAVCGHCHAADPHEPDGPLSGGLEFRNWRLGTARAANLTPDSVTGIGAWSDEEIIRAIRSGVNRDGHLLAPVMPYSWYRGMSDRDALAVARYLRSRPAVQNEVHSSPNLAYRLGRAFFLRPVTPNGPPRVAPSPTASYGGYIADHVSACIDCHTPRAGLRSTPDLDRIYAGDASPPAGFPANPKNLTPDTATGIGAWSEADFVRTLRTGVNPRGDSLHAFMPWREYRRMTDTDLIAIYRYLRTVPAIEKVVPRRRTP